MDLYKEVIQFSSVEPYYTAEKLGLKPNTTREIDMTDDRFRRLVMMAETGIYGKIKISIPNFLDSDEFIRQIEHICFWKNFCIISWRHNPDA